jgi:putative membrane protein
MRARAIFLRGLAMGAADIVPGVSGGTVALITGIYPRLLHSLRSVDLSFLRLLLRGDIGGAWRHIDGNFLSALLLGIVTSIFSLAQLLSWLLTHYPEPLWAGFFGLILASALLLLRQVPHWHLRQCSALLVGVAIALTVGLAPHAEFVGGMTGVFLAGFIAICAMILPGISGSFILVLLGMYGAVLTAVKELDFLFLVIFASGAGCGLMVFSRLLDWLLSRYRAATVALLTGFLFGSLVVVWPWKRVLAWVTDSHGLLKPAQQWPVGPADYLARTGEEPMLLLCAVTALVGFSLVWIVDHHWGQVQVDRQ